MSRKLEWWEPEILAKKEKELRTKSLRKFSNKGATDDFESYKLINKGASIKDSDLLQHNVCQEKNLKQILFDYVHILKKENRKTINTIADLGCGAGFTTNALKKNFCNSLVFGYEISFDAIEFAKNNFSECHFEQKMINPSFSLSEIKFDLIICQEFYPFTRTKNLEKHLRWLQFLTNNLNKGGIALITLPCSNSESINSSYEFLKNKFPLQRYTLALPRISSKLPFVLSEFIGKLSLLTLKRFGRQIYLLKS